MGLNGRGGDGSYHSTYDNPTWFKKYIDPQFKFSVLAAQVTGVALLRLADAEVLPFDYESYGRQILEYIGEIEKQATAASADDAKKVDFAGLRAAADAFAKAGADVRARGDALLASGSVRRAQRSPTINRRLIMAERDLIEPAGLPDRPWYRHVIYAPGLYTGYGVKTIPGVREAVDRATTPRGGAGGARHPRAAARDQDAMAVDRQRRDPILRICIGSSSSSKGWARSAGSRPSVLAGSWAGRRRRRRIDPHGISRVAIPASRSSRGSCRRRDRVGLAMVVGFWTPLFAFVAFFMALNFHIAAGAVQYSFLTNGYGCRCWATLALALAGGRRKATNLGVGA